MNTLSPSRVSNPQSHNELPSIRRVLFVRFGLVFFVVFGIALALIAAMIFGSRDKYITEFHHSLKQQVEANAQASLRDTSAAFENFLLEGVSGFLLPQAFTILDGIQRCSVCGNYSMPSAPSYADTQTNSNRAVVTNGRDFRFPLPLNNTVSSVYFFNQTSTGLDEPWNKYQSDIDLTSRMDWWTSHFWRRNPKWRSSYVGTDASGLFRFFPGTISTREIDNYNARVRVWYEPARTQARQALKNSSWQPIQDLMPPISHTAPTLAFISNSWVVTLSKAIYHPGPCLHNGLPECREAISTSNQFIGVLAVDMFVSNVRDIVTRVRNGQPGDAHLFVTATGKIVASPQWDALPEDPAMFITDIVVVTQTVSQGLRQTMKTHDSGVVEFDGALVSFQQIVGGVYTLCITSIIEEVIAPVEAKKQDISHAASLLMAICVAIAVVLFALVGLIVFLTSKSIADPLRITSKEAKEISNLLGGDMLSVIHPKRALAWGPREVCTLRRDYVVMLDALVQLRHSRGQQPPLQNPFFDRAELTNSLDEFDQEDAMLRERSQQPNVTTNDSSAPSESAQQMSASVPVQPDDESKFEKLMPLRRFLVVWIVLPVVAGLALVMITASVGVSESMRSWTPSVCDKIIESEKANILVRTDTLQDLTTSMFARMSQSALLFKEYTELVWNAGHDLDPNLNLSMPSSSYPIFHDRNAPVKQSPWTDTPEGGVQPSPRFPDLRAWDNNMRFMVIYDNANSAAKGESGYATPFRTDEWKNKVVPQQRLLSHVDNAARAIYMSNEMMLQMYVGLEETETLRMYPYRDLSSYYSASFLCEANNMTLVAFSPVCRHWYQAAKNLGPNESISFNPISIGVTSRQALLGISFNLIDAKGQFFGAGAIDLNVNSLNTFIRSMTLYQHGYVYVMDRRGFAVMHKDLVLTSSQISIESLEYGCASANEINTYRTSIFPYLQNGESSDGVVSHQRCGQTWLSVWRPVNGTPYMFVATVPYNDIIKPADDFNRKSKATLIGFEVGFAFLWIACTLVCMWFVRRFTEAITAPVATLATFLRKMHAANYSVDTPKITSNCQELALIQSGIDDLLIALRFGNSQYSCGNLVKELDNFFHAKRIVERNQYLRGTGIVYNNIGNTMRQLQKESGSSVFNQFSNQLAGKDAKWFLEKSVGIAQELALSGDTLDEDKQALSQRLFNLGVYFLSVNDEPSAGVQFGRCLSETVNGESTHVADVLVRYAYSLVLLDVPSQTATATATATEVYATSTLPLPLPASLRSQENIVVADSPLPNASSLLDTPTGMFAQRFVEAALQSGRVLSPGGLAMLCFVNGLLRGDSRFWTWALVNLREMGVFYIVRLAAFLKSDEPSLMQLVDEVMSEMKSVSWVSGHVSPEQAFVVEWPGSTTSKRPIRMNKTLLFCLDVSGSMAGSRLQQCKDALLMICNNHCTNKDNIGLVTFSSIVNFNQPIALRGTCHSQMVSQVNSLTALSGTSFYQALKSCLEQMHTVQSEPKWLVALTDGDDNQSTPRAYLNVTSALSNPSTRVNLAIITVGSSFSAGTMTAIQSLIAAAQKGGNTAQHILAENVCEIEAAFQTVVGLIDDSLAFTEFL